MREDDVDALLGVFADPNVMAVFNTEPFNREQMKHWVRRNLDHQQRHGYGLFSVILRETGLLIGDCGFERMELDGEENVELGYDLRSDHWNRGLASEAASAVRDYAFIELQLPGLISIIRHGNLPSRRVAEKIGMTWQKDFERHGHGYWLFALSHEQAKP
jgi:RimJ/RimL family protein N-acetyltransferase